MTRKTKGQADETDVKIGRNIRAARQLRSWTQERLAEVEDCSGYLTLPPITRRRIDILLMLDRLENPDLEKALLVMLKACEAKT